MTQANCAETEVPKTWSRETLRLLLAQASEHLASEGFRHSRPVTPQWEGHSSTTRGLFFRGLHLQAAVCSFQRLPPDVTMSSRKRGLSLSFFPRTPSRPPLTARWPALGHELMLLAGSFRRGSQQPCLLTSPHFPRSAGWTSDSGDICLRSGCTRQQLPPCSRPLSPGALARTEGASSTVRMWAQRPLSRIPQGTER